MLRRIRPRLTYANVVSTLCLFALLGGGAYAANKITAKDLAKNSVKSKAIKNGQVKPKDIKTGAVGTDQLADGGITSADIAAGAIAADDLAGDERVHLVGAAGEPAFGRGGEGDCVWSAFSASPGASGVEPVHFYKDSRGRVHLSGAAVASEVPGTGDEQCGATTPEPDDSGEDGVIFTLPPAYRPAKAVLLPGPGLPNGTLYIVIGEQPVTLGSATIPPGSVFGNAGGGSSQQVMSNSWLAGDSPSAAPLKAGPGAASSGERIGPKTLERLLGG